MKFCAIDLQINTLPCRLYMATDSTMESVWHMMNNGHWCVKENKTHRMMNLLLKFEVLKEDNILITLYVKLLLHPMRWGRRNFGSKLSNHAVESFRSMVRRLESDKSSSSSNSHSNALPHFSLDDADHSPNTPVPNPLIPPLTTPQLQSSNQKHLTKPLSKPPSSFTQTSHSPKPSTPYSHQPSTSHSSHTPTTYSSKPSTSYSSKPSTSYSTKPSTPYSPKPSTPQSHPSSNTSPPITNHLTNFFTPPSLDPMNAPRNIQGKNDILSNFYPSQLTFRGNSFCSTEQAYEYERAMFLGELDVAQSIGDAKDAVQAKHILVSLSRLCSGFVHN